MIYEYNWNLAGFKGTNELDESEIKNIQKEYFKSAFLYSLIAFIIAVVLLVVDYVFLFVLDINIPDALIIPAAVCMAPAPFFFVRCILTLRMVSKIYRQDFLWREGVINRRKLYSPVKLFGIIKIKPHLCYLIDDEYYVEIFENPVYKRGTTVYILYFPGFSGKYYIGGAVARKNS